MHDSDHDDLDCDRDNHYACTYMIITVTDHDLDQHSEMYNVHTQ